MKPITKFSRAVIAIALMLGVWMPTLAHDFEVYGIYYNYIDKTTKTVAVTYKGNSYNSYSNEYTSSVTIPSSVTYSGTTYSVTSIGQYAFRDCHGLTSVTIGNSVTSIGKYAFYDCDGLKSVTIGNSVTSIGNYAFEYCDGLTSVTIPNSVTSIGDGAFEHCSGLTSVTIPNSVTSIGNYAFRDCYGLTEVTIPNSVTSIGIYTFYDCTGLISVTIGNSVTSIGNSAFYGCTGLTSVTIPNSVTSIGEDAFRSCSGLTSVTIGNSVTSIGNSAFYGCTGLIEVNYNAENCISMGDSSYPVFSGCSYIKIINIGNGVKNIPSYAFYNSIGLTYTYNKVTAITSGRSYILAADANAATAVAKDKNYGYLGVTTVTTVAPEAAGINAEDAATIEFRFEAASNGNFYIIDAYDRYLYMKGTYNYFDLSNSVPAEGGEWSVSVNDDGTLTIKNVLKEKTLQYDANYYSYGAYDTVKGAYPTAYEKANVMTLVSIPNSVTSISEYAFGGCVGLNTFVSLNPTPPSCVNSGSFDDKNYTNATLYVPKDSYAKYFVDEVWGLFSNIKKIETLVTSIELNCSYTELVKDSITILSTSISPSDATIKDIVWESSNPQIVTVDQSGKVTALSIGTASITAKTIDGSGMFTSCEITVVAAKIALSQTEVNLPVNDIMTLTYTVAPSGTTVEWSTSNQNVVYLKNNSDGSVTLVGMADGEAIVTAKATDGSGASASCKVIVGAGGAGGVEGIEADNDVVEIARYDIHGRILREPVRGVNIIKMNDGTIRKEFVK